MDRQAVKPPFAYYGGKTTLAPIIAGLLPPHDHYVEPFAGSLAVLLAKAPSMHETVNDIDGDLVTFWRVLRDQPDQLEWAAHLTPHSRAELELARDLDVGSDIERARRVWVRITQSRSNSLRHSGWRYLVEGKGAGTSKPDYTSAYAARIPHAAKRLRGVSLECRDAVELIRDYGASENVCIYADPPYLGSTRAANYGKEMLADDAHTTLAAALNGCKASVVLSGYASPLYESLFTGWHRTELKAPTALSGKAAEPEVLWSNVPLGVQGVLDFGAVS